MRLLHALLLLSLCGVPALAQSVVPPAATHPGRRSAAEHFADANTTHDGHLTLAQAKAANMKFVTDHFADIDTKHRGYVTFYDIQAWGLDNMAKHMEHRAEQLRAQD